MRSKATPSSAHIWGVHGGCTGYFDMTEGYETRRSVEAEQGVLGHKLLEGENVTEHVDPEILEAVRDIQTFIDERKKAHPNAKFYHELKCESETKVGPGVIDFAMYDPEKKLVEIVDFKLGRSPVEVYKNPTLMIYLDQFVRKFRITDTETAAVLRILQPRGFHKEGPFRHWFIRSISDLRANFNQINGYADEVHDDPKARSGPYCRYCPARFNCQSSINTSMGLYETTLEAIPTILDTAQQARYLSVLRLAKTRIEAIEHGLSEELDSKLRRGEAVPGWSLEPTLSRRKWTKPIEDIKSLEIIFDKKLTEEKPIPPTQAIKLGIDETVINEYSSRTSGLKLKETPAITAAKKFEVNND